MRNYYVYKHTCPNGKVYIGITFRKPKERWKNGLGYKKNNHFWNAIKKYGWNNIKHEVLYEGLNKEEAEAKEIELIAYYQSTNKKFGYNHAVGGCVNSGWKWTSDSIRKAVETRKKNYKRENHCFYGKHFSEEHRRKIAEGNRGKKQKPFTLETRKKMSESAKKRKRTPQEIEQLKQANQKVMKPVEQINIEDGNVINVFRSTTEALAKTGVNPSSITACCKGRRKTAGGYHWRYSLDTTKIGN